MAETRMAQRRPRRSLAVKKTWMLLAAVAVLVLAVGCQKREPGRLLAVTYQTMDNPFFVDLDAGLREVIEAHGDRLVTLDAQWDDGKQLNDISDMVLRGAAGIFVNPVDWQGIRGSLLKAKQKGVPCIVVDAPAKDKDLALCTVASDNVKAGRLAAEALVKELAKDHRPGNIAILHHSLNKACLDRVAGFREVVDKRPDMKVIVTQEGRGTTEGARPVMQDLIEPSRDQRGLRHQRPQRLGGGLGAGGGEDAAQRDDRDRGRLPRRDRGGPGRQDPLHVGAVPQGDRPHRRPEVLRAPRRQTGRARSHGPRGADHQGECRPLPQGEGVSRLRPIRPLGRSITSV